jgi:hypothetical protein
MVERIFARTEHLAEFPRFGAEVPEYADEALRELLESPYRIVYRLYENRLDIVAVVTEPGECRVGRENLAEPDAAHPGSYGWLADRSTVIAEQGNEADLAACLSGGSAGRLESASESNSSIRRLEHKFHGNLSRGRFQSPRLATAPEWGN